MVITCLARVLNAKLSVNRIQDQVEKDLGFVIKHKICFEVFFYKRWVWAPPKDSFTFAAATTAVLLRVERQLRLVVCL